MGKGVMRSCYENRVSLTRSPVHVTQADMSKPLSGHGNFRLDVLRQHFPSPSGLVL